MKKLKELFAMKTKVKLSSIITIFIIIFCCFIALHVRHTWVNHLREANSNALKLSESAASFINVDYISKLKASEADIEKPEYKQIKESLIEFKKQNSEIAFAHLYTLREGKIYFMVDSEQPGSEGYSPPGQEYYEATDEDKQPFFSGKSVITGPTTDRRGTWISALAPIKGSDGKVIAVFGIDYYASKWYQHASDVTLLTGLTDLFLFLLILSFIVLFMKMTELSNVSGKLKESENRFLNVMYTSDDAIGLLDEDFRFIDCNERAARMNGYESREDFIDKHLHPSEFSPSFQPDGKSSFEKANEMIWTALKKGYNRFEWIHKRKNGEIFPAEVSLTPVIYKGRELVYAVWRDISDLKKAEEELEKNRKETIESIIEVASEMLRSKDYYTADHQKRVAKLSSAIAKEMSLAEEKIELIKLASLVHDIGKIAIPSEILLKPGKLSESEFNLVKEHTQIGYELLKNLKPPWDIISIVALEHHERIDGSGYPRGLKNEEISLEAKIVAVSDVIEAMISHRPFRPALSLDKALEEISRGKGKLFDSNLVDICIKLFKKNGFIFD